MATPVGTVRVPVEIHTVGSFEYSTKWKKNEKADKSALVQYKDFNGSAYGAFKVVDLFSKVCKESVEIAKLAKDPVTAASIQSVGSTFSRIGGAFIVPHTIITAIEVVESVQEVANDGATSSNVESMVKSIFEFTTAGCLTMMQFVPSNVFKSVATVTGLAGDSIELKQQASQFSTVDALQSAEGLSTDLQTDLAQKKTQHLLGIIKSVASVVGGIFAFLGMIFAATIVPAIVSATVGLVAITFTFIKHFYSENMDNKLTITREVVQLAPAETAAS